MPSEQLAEVDASYHTGATPPTLFRLSRSVFRPDDFFTVPLQMQFSGPRNIREYYGLVSPDRVWRFQSFDTPNANGAAGHLFDTTYGVLDRPGGTVVDRNESPLALGAEALYPGVQQAQPDRFFDICAGCRQGGTFYPYFSLVNGATPASSAGAGGFPPGAVHLYTEDGQEIAATPLLGIATYRLPAERARYRLVTESTTCRALPRSRSASIHRWGIHTRRSYDEWAS